MGDSEGESFVAGRFGVVEFVANSSLFDKHGEVLNFVFFRLLWLMGWE